MSFLRICIVGEHPGEREYTRFWVIREGLRQVGFEVDIIPVSTGVDIIECLLNPKQVICTAFKQVFQLTKHFSSISRCDIILIPAFRWPLVPFILSKTDQK